MITFRFALLAFLFIALADAKTHAADTADYSMQFITPSSINLVLDKPNEITLTLQDPEGAVLPNFKLKEVHEHKIHLLIINPELTEYKHVHPIATPIPGEYRFTFTPHKSKFYKAWADITPTTDGKQRFLMANLGNITAYPKDRNGRIILPPISARKEALKNTTRDGVIRFVLSFKDTPKAGEDNIATLEITTADGKKFDKLEPLMGAFGHLVGFSEKIITPPIHSHPLNEPKSAKELGSSPLQFHLHFPKAGFFRFYAQLKIGGSTGAVPFGVIVK